MAIKDGITGIRLEEEITIKIEQTTSTWNYSFRKIGINPKESFLEGQLCSNSSNWYGQIQIIDWE